MNEEISTVVRELANELGTTVEYLWGVLVAQAPIYMVGSLLAHSVLIIISIFILRFLYKFIKYPPDSWDEEYIMGTIIGATVVSCVMTIFPILSLIISIPTYITIIFNPEYWALQQILDKL